MTQICSGRVYSMSMKMFYEFILLRGCYSSKSFKNEDFRIIEVHLEEDKGDKRKEFFLYNFKFFKTQKF